MFNHNWGHHGPCLLLFSILWKFHTNPIQLKFEQIPLLFLHKFLIGWIIFTKLFFIWHYLWVLKFIKVGVPCVSSWIFNDLLKVVDFKKQQKISRWKVDKTLSYCITILILYTKIELMDLKVCMKVIINKMFKLKFHRSKFLLNHKTTLDFRVLWLKNKKEINLFQNFCNSFDI